MSWFRESFHFVKLSAHGKGNIEIAPTRTANIVIRIFQGVSGNTCSESQPMDTVQHYSKTLGHDTLKFCDDLIINVDQLGGFCR